ncbi:hypothetical protein [Arthrobacter sp. E3]|uniref:hypothetical protein n=1 Tax=Arthrobacter sp. E3 TaxID=517402 RepID=UPI001A951235|nr:hypothetical protein [Arthrobacter sp. E3]
MSRKVTAHLFNSLNGVMERQNLRQRYTFGQWINPVRKHVVSATLPDELPWNNTRIAGDPVVYVKNLRGHGAGQRHPALSPHRQPEYASNLDPCRAPP